VSSMMNSTTRRKTACGGRVPAIHCCTPRKLAGAAEELGRALHGPAIDAGDHVPPIFGERAAPRNRECPDGRRRISGI
jgi:hypothetical protein